jgi:hypothetical protein
MQPAGEFRATESKEVQGKKLAFPWIPLVESGLFNALQRKKKKIALRSDSPIELCKTAAASAVSH